MAVINNTFTEIGDAAIVKAQIPVTGIISFHSFNDITAGVLDDRFFKKEFRFSFDAINFSSWKEIISDVISFEVEVVSGVVFFEFRYTREGSNNLGLLTWSGVNVETTVSRSYLSKIDTLTNSFYPTGWAWKAKPVAIEDIVQPEIEGGLQDVLQSTIYG